MIGIVQLKRMIQLLVILMCSLFLDNRSLSVLSGDNGSTGGEVIIYRTGQASLIR